MEARVNAWKDAPQLMQGFLALNDQIEAAGLEPSLLHLVKLRASQLNGCAFCVDMHTREARKDGETEQRLYLTSAWRDSFLYTSRERAALAWTEAVTRLGAQGPDDALWAETRQHFPDDQIIKLTAVVVMINSWNRLSVAFRSVHAAPGAVAA
ncbi:carboxymuconolactone decarboxylase family protein [Actibacterium ureilyticum]|uniref:carboxymuconolactone decarboxylase family protein n=1 Tax=Actibacterium ureilyticum TaxID=1590614 RepID=UPI000BAB02FF|nr:carboxymuconolactone decarboxylase family protein [Actibacterium ureilyticum]